jgi:flagellar motor switch protein FliN
MIPQTKVEAYFEAWVSSLALLLSKLSSVSWQPEPATDAPDYAPIVRVRVTAINGLNGQQWFSFSAADMTELLRIFLQQESSDTAELDQRQKEAVVELVRQWAGLAASTLEQDFSQVSLQVALEAKSSECWPAAKLLRVNDGARSIAVLIQIDDKIVTALDRRTTAPGKTPNEHPSAQVDDLLRQGNLGLLMDVELGVMLQFGCRRTTLREVLELATGAVLELDREIQEPVDLLLNGRVIARGEVVVIDGNYGLRVTEVASPQQRVDSL